MRQCADLSMCYAMSAWQLTHWYIDTLFVVKNVKILELNKNKFNTPLFFGRTFVLLKTHLP